MQVVDLQESKRFQGLEIELLSIAPDSPDDWLDDGREYGISQFDTVLSDEGNAVANSYNVMQWQAATGEPGHTFVLVDESGKISWVKDYGAPKHGGVMWVAPDELVRELESQLYRYAASNRRSRERARPKPRSFAR
jgi:peroxiredoxin